jgi:pimeloyl-ACP methyl ester carboxylesterase
MRRPRNEVLRLKYQGDTIEIAARIRRAGKDLIVFLHGLGCSKESFNRAFRTQTLQAYSMCAFDFPGHGKSSRLPQERYSLQSYADITNLVLHRLAFNRIHVVGHSMGGAVAVIAMQGKDRADCLISADGNLVAEDCGLISRKIANQSTEAFMDEGFSQFLAALRSSSRKDFEAWFEWCKGADPQALHHAARSLVEWSDSGELLERFNALGRKAYLYGGLDDKRYVLEQLVKASVTAVPGAGHFMMVDNPDTFYRMLACELALEAPKRSAYTAICV